LLRWDNAAWKAL